MSLLAKLKALVSDPAPEFAFEISAAGLASVHTPALALRWHPFRPGTLRVSPTENNLLDPEAFAETLRAAAPPQPGKARRAALILPDFCARVAVVDFDTFPTDPAEQLQLARFRAKRVVPFDIDSAAIACFPQPRAGSKKVDVVVAVVNLDVASHYEAPFRAAGFELGFVTVSALAALALPPTADAALSPCVTAKFSGQSVALSLVENHSLRLFRCVELRSDPFAEASDLLATTFAYAEDELGARPRALRLCGLEPGDEDLAARWAAEFDLPVSSFSSRLGAPNQSNAGLVGYLESLELR